MTETKLTLGQYFKLEREKREITLAEIEKRTKISKQTLQFMEDDRIDVLPPRAFLRGFLQCIAKEFAMDGEELIRHLDEALADYDKNKKPNHLRGRKRKGGLFYLITVLVIIMVIVLVALFCVRRTDQPAQQSLRQAPTEQSYSFIQGGAAAPPA